MDPNGKLDTYFVVEVDPFVGAKLAAVNIRLASEEEYMLAPLRRPDLHAAAGRLEIEDGALNFGILCPSPLGDLRDERGEREMIFAHTWEQILSGEKTQTRRIVHPRESVEVDENGDVVAVYRLTSNGNWHERWRVGKTYAIQAKRGGPAIGRFRLKSLRTERLQDIDPDDVRAEGCRHDLDVGPMDFGFNADDENLSIFKALWDDVHSRPPEWWRYFSDDCPFPGVKWADNPRVWVLTFELL